MSSHAATKIDQKEYLKKYLSGDKVKKKKKDKKHKKEIRAAKVKIIDDDVAYSQTQEEFDEELILGGEDAPQIVGEYIEDISNRSNVPKWRSIVKNELVDEIAMNVSGKQQDDLWGPKQIKHKIKDEFSPPRRNVDKELQRSTPDHSPQRRRNSYKAVHKSTRNDSSLNESRSGKYEHSPTRRTEKVKRYSSDQGSSRKSEQTASHTHRSKNQRTPDNSRPKRSNGYDDQSPLKRDKCTPDNSPQRRRKITPDNSPRRRDHRSNDTYNGREYSNQSPRSKIHKARSRSPQKVSSKRNYSSPEGEINRSMRKNNAKSPSSDQSPPRKEKHKTKSRRSSSNSVNLSPQCRYKRNTSSDQSPPRRKNAERNRKRSISPVKRRGRNVSDQSPPRRYKDSRQRSFSPVSIKREKVSPKLSPSRIRQVAVKKERSPSPSPSHSRWSKMEERRNSDSPPPTHKPKVTKTLDGKKAGLQDAKALIQETEERRRREERMYNEMSKEVSGRDAEVRVRNTGRKGQRARDAEAEDPEVRRRKEEHERKKKEKYDRWGKGLKQVEAYRQRTEAETYEGSKPLARYENDKDLDNFLREQERADDPMLEYMRKKKNERQKEQGTLVEVPKYEGSYPENRFGIRPGYRWDGVDRSNGFEKKWFDVQNEKRALQEEAYLYSVEDM